MDDEKLIPESCSDQVMGYKKCCRLNDSFFRYYQIQQIVPVSEWDSFVSFLVKDLPSSFRVKRNLPERAIFVEFMHREYFDGIEKLASESNDPEIKVPVPVSGLPFAFQMEMSRQFVRRHPLLKSFHDFLIDETTIGNISRQEIVSMIPPLLLNIEPHHLVLDACASPGSKTMQILEIMHENSSNPDGLLIANDIENKRCYMLVHQTLKRMPSANLVVVNHDASKFPTVVDSSGSRVLFDRILCDVICSGDGTLRKNPDLWERWSPISGINLHKLQVQISERCFQLLSVEGLMCYSTCSFNPIENEAVLAHLLRTFKEEIELVDVNEQLPWLNKSQGLSKWKIIGKGMNEYASQQDIPENERSYFQSSMFPPSDQEVQWMHLDRSFRVLPHKHNTGGFFIAILRKKLAKEIDNSETGALDCIQVPRMPYPKARRFRFKENPFIFLSEDELNTVSKQLESHYGINKSIFPMQNLLGRSESGKREIYYVNDRLRDFLNHNSKRFHIVNAGLNILRNDKKVSPCFYRIKQDGLQIIVPFMKKRIIDVDLSDFISIVNVSKEQQYKMINELSKPELFLNFDAGSVVLRLKTELGFSLQICTWIGANTINPFISREEKIHLLRVLGAVDTTLLQRPIFARKNRVTAAVLQTHNMPLVDQNKC